MSLWFYRGMSRWLPVSYSAKIMVMAFLGTHIPLISLSVWLGVHNARDWSSIATTLAVTLIATLAGTALTLFVLAHLLRPVLATSVALRRYRADRSLPRLPVGFADAAGTLMADAQATLTTLEESLTRLERMDEGTGLPNRAAFLAGLDGTGIAVLRVANLARIADGLGAAHAARVMAVVAARVAPQALAHPARVGAADIALMLDESDGLDDAGHRLRTLMQALAAPVDLGGLSAEPVLTCGLAPWSGTAEATLDAGLAALAETGDHAPLVTHSAALQVRLRDRFEIEQDLRRALRENELSLHFQPLVDLSSRKTTGAEALLRWRHPHRGMIAPGVFVPVAEAAGLIDPIGLWVLREACHQAATWVDDLTVAVNVGARQFLDPDMVWHVSEALAASGLPPQRLEIELTESVATTDDAHTRRVFDHLRTMGVAIAIDDFGTGYSSLSTLRRLPFDKLKIDREFVTEVQGRPQSAAICAAMIALGRGLGIRVLAEGTETPAEVAHLRAAGCTRFQGYHFSRPVAAADFALTVRGLNGRLTAQAA